MYELETLTGRVVEARRYLNRIPGLRDDDPSRERWELWVTDVDSNDHKIISYSQSMPARVGHAVTIIHLEGRGAGLNNLTTGQRVSFVRADPPPLLRNTDVVTLVFGSFGALMGGAFWHPLAWLVIVPLLVLYAPAVMAARGMARAGLLKQVDRLLNQIQVDNVVKPFRPRR